MVKKKLNLFEDPPTASSSEEDEVETLSGDDEEEDEEEIEQRISSDDSSSDEEEEEEEHDLMNPVNVSSVKKPKSLSAAASGRTTVSSAVNQTSKSDSGSERSKEGHSSPAVKSMRKPKEGRGSPAVKSVKKLKEGCDSPAVKSSSAADPEKTTTSAVKPSEPESVKAKQKEIRGSPEVKSMKKSMEVRDSPAVKSMKKPKEGGSPAVKSPSVAVPGQTTTSAALKAKGKEVRGSMKSGKKRTSENISKDIDNVKRKKKKVSEEDISNIASDAKKPMLFQRLWSQEDEISLLQGMIDFKADTGKSPYKDMNGFYELAMKSIRFDASKSQFMDKIRSLKRKYMRKMHKGLGSVLNGHDKECLKLANCIWGSDETAIEYSVNGEKVEEDEEVSGDSESLGAKIAYWFSDKVVGSANKTNVKPRSERKLASVEGNGKKVEEDKEVFGNGGDSESLDACTCDWFEESFLFGSYESLGVNEQFLKRKWRTAPMEIRKRIEEKLKSLHAKEMEVVADKTDIMNEVSSMIA